MTTKNLPRRQGGFFDLGIGLGLMLVFGTTAVVTTPDESTIAKKDSTEIQAPAETAGKTPEQDPVVVSRIK